MVAQAPVAAPAPSDAQAAPPLPAPPVALAPAPVASAPLVPSAPAAPVTAQAPQVAAVAVAEPPSTGAKVRGASMDQVLQPHLQRLQQRLQATPLDGYTVQLAALPRDEGVVNYMNNLTHLVDSAMVFAQHSTYNGKQFVSVFYGQYTRAGDAAQAVAALPGGLKTNKPIVRTWVKIKQDQSP